MLSGIPGVACLEPQGAFYCFPSFEALLGRESAGPQGHDHGSSWPRCCSTRSKVAIVPGEAFGAPGYARLSFALGDDDLGEGVGRIADFSLDGAPAPTLPRPRARLTLGCAMTKRVLVAEELAERGLDSMRAAGLEVDVQLGLSPERAARRGARRGRARDPQRDAGDRRGARRRHRSRRRRSGGHRARQRRRRRRDPARRHGGERAAVERALGRRADDRADARAGAQHPAGRRRPQGRAVEPLALGRRRALRQDARHRRARPGRRARRAARPSRSGCGSSRTTRT